MSRNITIYGDSILKGITLDGDRYVINHGPEAEFERETGIQIRNKCRFGFTSVRGLELIKKDIAANGKPGDIALIEYGGNDSDYKWNEVAETCDAEHDPLTPPENFRETYREIIRTVAAAGSQPVAAIPIPVLSERYFAWFSRGEVDGDRVLHWLGDVNAIYRGQEKFATIVREVAAEENVPVLDLRSAFLYDRRMPRFMSEDGIHPSVKGQELIWKTIAAFFTPAAGSLKIA